MEAVIHAVKDPQQIARPCGPPDVRQCYCSVVHQEGRWDQFVQTDTADDQAS